MKRLFFAAFLVFNLFVLTSFAGNKNGNLWQEIIDRSSRQIGLEQNLPDAYRVFSLNQKSMKILLRQAPEEFTAEAANAPLILTLPMPDGSLARFRVEHSLIVEPGLVEKFPELSQTYRGQGIDDPTATVRFDFLPSGFHSMILSASGTILVDPYIKGNTEDYISYYKRDAVKHSDWVCQFGDADSEDFFKQNNDFLSVPNAPNVTSGTTLRTYRLALAADGEYTQAVGGGTVAGAQAAEVLIMNRVDGVYERDLAIRMVIIANNNLIIYTDPATDPYSNTNANTLLTQNQSNLNTVIGSANYDIGHVFTTGGGGLAGLGVVCNNTRKAQAETGLANPVGDAFAIDFVAHEMGHQFGANHTFNNNSVGSCAGGNRAASAAYEPGSGITIMAYAGICGNQDLALHSIDTFHVKSLEEIITYTQTSTGNTCPAQTATGNTAPMVAPVGAFNIPKQTPFALTTSAIDANNDSITYDWQEYDLGAATGTVPNTDSDGVAKPIFRPYSPTTGGTRMFPSLQYILNNNNVPPSTFDCGRGAANPCLTGELLPAITRTMNFQVIARDNRSGGGGINTIAATVNVDGNSGPFVVTAPNTNVSWAANTSQTVTWNVANTTNATVNAANVNIKLSTDGGQTFPTTLAANTPNDGTENVFIPNTGTTTARIKVEAANNIFFDVSDTNFTISAPTAASVSISGRVLTATGRGIYNARVSMTNPQGEIATVLTNSFGYYRFNDVPAGMSYVFSVSDKRYKFNSAVISLIDNVEDYNFTALP